MTQHLRNHWLGTAALVIGCGSAPEEAKQPGPKDWEGVGNPTATSVDEFLAAEYDSVPASELEARRDYFAQTVTVAGRVLDEDGQAVAGATVRVGELLTTSDDDGRFAFTEVVRRNSSFSVEASTYRAHWAGLELNVPLDQALVEVPDVYLVAKDPSVTRFLFAGDTSFGRRFLDPTESFDRGEMPSDNPEALIQVSDPLPGSREVLSRVAGLLRNADFPVVNLETVVTLEPNTPHRDKSYAYFSLPGSLPALTELGISYVGLGNNHVYDYLEPGLADTLDHVTEAGLDHSGAGSNADEAFVAHRQTLGGHPYSFLAMTSVSGEQFALSYTATAKKGGAADLRDDVAVTSAIQRELDLGRLPILFLHTGREYSVEPSDFVLDRLGLVSALSPALMIGHHPHVAQGFGFHNDVLAVHSLGNFLFDQVRLETMLSMLVQIDLSGVELGAVRAIPIYIEDSVPRLLVGPSADRFLRHLAELSAPHGASLVPYAGWGWVSRAGNDELAEERDVTLDVDVPEQGFAIVDLRPLLGSTEALSRVQLPADTEGRLGRDILEGHGDFEDIDVDSELYELSRWDVTGASSFPCLSRAYRGTDALCSVRNAGQTSDSTVTQRNRVRVLGDSEHQPNKALSLLTYIKGENAGKVTFDTRYYASVGALEFGDETAFEKKSGSYDWELMAVDLTMPPDDPENAESSELNARALRVFIRHSPPSRGDGLLAVDDVAIINWDLEFSAGTPLVFDAPQAREFLRVEAPAGRYEVTLGFRRY